MKKAKTAKKSWQPVEQRIARYQELIERSRTNITRSEVRITKLSEAVARLRNKTPQEKEVTVV